MLQLLEHIQPLDSPWDECAGEHDGPIQLLPIHEVRGDFSNLEHQSIFQVDQDEAPQNSQHYLAADGNINLEAEKVQTGGGGEEGSGGQRGAEKAPVCEEAENNPERKAGTLWRRAGTQLPLLEDADQWSLQSGSS